MQEWVRNRNIEEFRKRLAEATSEEQRRVLLRLIAEEEGRRPFVPEPTSDK
jgi:hypothetical protein